jgi:hypothetical protein
MKIKQVAENVLPLFAAVLRANFDKSMRWATYWAIFSQTRLVTLFPIPVTRNHQKWVVRQFGWPKGNLVFQP